MQDINTHDIQRLVTVCNDNQFIIQNIWKLRFGIVPSSTYDTLELSPGLSISCVPWDPPFLTGYLSIDVSLLTNPSSSYHSNLYSRREKLPLLCTQRYLSSVFPCLKPKLPSFPLSLPVSWQAGGPDFLPRWSSHLPKVPSDPVLTLDLPPVFFPPALTGDPAVDLDGSFANSGLVVAPYGEGP